MVENKSYWIRVWYVRKGGDMVQIENNIKAETPVEAQETPTVEDVAETPKGQLLLF